jgi:hypothetical protein
MRIVMTRLFRASIAVVSALAVAPYALNAQEPTPKKGDLPKSNQVFLKIILPGDLAPRDKDRPIIESWIAEQLKQLKQSKSTAATGWVLLDRSPRSGTMVWDGKLGDKRWGCDVCAHADVRADGRIKVVIYGWNQGSPQMTVSLKDEPGIREIAAVEGAKTDQGLPYVAILICPPPESPAAPTDHKK